MQSGPQPHHFRKSAENPGHREEATWHISNAVPTHSTPGIGREYRTLGRGEAAFSQSGPHPGIPCTGIHSSSTNLDATPETRQPTGANMKMPPWYQEVTGNDPPRYYLRPVAVTQGVGTYDLHQFFSVQTTIMVYTQLLVNIGFIRYHYVDAIFSFQNVAQYAPTNYI